MRRAGRPGAAWRPGATVLLLVATMGGVWAERSGEPPERVAAVEYVYLPGQPPYLQANDVERLAGIRPGDPLAPSRVQALVKDLYALQVFRRVDVYQAERPDGVAIRIELDCLPQLARVVWPGARHIKPRRLRREVNLSAGVILPDALVVGAVARTQTIYREEGFLDVRVEPHLISEGDGYRLELRVNEGVRYRVRDIEVQPFSGQVSPGALATARRLAGQPYRQRALTETAETLAALYRRDGFPATAVESFLSPVADRAGWIDVAFTVDPGPRLQVSVSGVSIPADQLTQMLALYRLGDVSPFAEELSREDIRAHLAKRNIHAVAVDS